MTIHKIKGIEHGVIELPIENGIYALVGNNGCGKSTIMSCMAQLVSRRSLKTLMLEDYDNSSYIEFSYNGKNNRWTPHNGQWYVDDNMLKFNGTYEGSLFYGQRFDDSKSVDLLIEQNKIACNFIVDADNYIVEKLDVLLHNDPEYYSGLKKLEIEK